MNVVQAGEKHKIMNKEMPVVLTPQEREEIAESERDRTISDADYLRDRKAHYKVDEKGNKVLKFSSDTIRDIESSDEFGTVEELKKRKEKLEKSRKLEKIISDFFRSNWIKKGDIISITRRNGTSADKVEFNQLETHPYYNVNASSVHSNGDRWGASVDFVDIESIKLIRSLMVQRDSSTLPELKLPDLDKI